MTISLVNRNANASKIHTVVGTLATITNVKSMQTESMNAPSSSNSSQNSNVSYYNHPLNVFFTVLTIEIKTNEKKINLKKNRPEYSEIF